MRKFALGNYGVQALSWMMRCENTCISKSNFCKESCTRLIRASTVSESDSPPNSGSDRDRQPLSGLRDGPANVRNGFRPFRNGIWMRRDKVITEDGSKPSSTATSKARFMSTISTQLIQALSQDFHVWCMVNTAEEPEDPTGFVPNAFQMAHFILLRKPEFMEDYLEYPARIVQLSVQMRTHMHNRTLVHCSIATQTEASTDQTSPKVGIGWKNFYLPEELDSLIKWIG